MDIKKYILLLPKPLIGFVIAFDLQSNCVQNVPSTI